MKPDVLNSCHSDITCTAAHLGFDKTYAKISEHYFWQTMRKDIQDFVCSCPQCQNRKNPVKITRAPLIPVPIVDEPFNRIAIDVVGPLLQSESGNQFIVVCSDYLTRWPEAFAVPDTTAPTIARLFVENIVCRHGAPRVLLSDQGTNFLSKLVSEICQIVGTKQIKNSP